MQNTTADVDIEISVSSAHIKISWDALYIIVTFKILRFFLFSFSIF